MAVSICQGKSKSFLIAYKQESFNMFSALECCHLDDQLCCGSTQPICAISQHWLQAVDLDRVYAVLIQGQTPSSA